MMRSKYSLVLLLLLSIIGVVLLSTTASLADHHQQPSKPGPSLNLANDHAVKAGYWYYQSGFPVASISPTLFNHLFAAFAYVNDTTYEVTFPPGYEGIFQNFTKAVHCSQNPYIKTFLSIGGEASNPSIFASMTSSSSSREAFINSSIDVARTNFYFGLSLNWQYPYTSDEMTNLGLLLTEWRAALEEEANRTGYDRLLLTADVFYSSYFWPSLEYPIQEIVDSLDWINVMAYDIHTPISSPNLTEPPAPFNNPLISRFSIEYGVGAWISSGVPRNFIVLGLPFYGRSWILVNENNHEILSPARGPVPGLDPISYSKIVTIKIPPAVAKYDPAYVTNYLYNGSTWIGYDDTHTISIKIGHAKLMGLHGYFAWHVDDDTADWALSTAAFHAWDADDHEFLLGSA
ncbi:class V chitinase-like [Corylus avellana]|uniref:class V chitinase-like n=1 Tax=Corylus avellana TaxID=13451 RepID=UPI001E233DA2|nr:class V chitinase-like [Corylus avellana]